MELRKDLTETIVYMTLQDDPNGFDPSRRSIDRSGRTKRLSVRSHKAAAWELAWAVKKTKTTHRVVGIWKLKKKKMCQRRLVWLRWKKTHTHI